MANRHPKCEICLLRHRPGNCKGRPGKSEISPGMAIDCQSTALLIADLPRIAADLAVLVGKLPCVEKAKREIQAGESPPS